MMPTIRDPASSLSAAHRRELAAAVRKLERPTFAARIADYAGKPVTELIKLMPRPINRRFQALVRSAIFQCLEVAIESLDPDDGAAASPFTNKIMVGLTGGVGGFFGIAALPFELPLTTTLMLRSIAEIAREHGEDLSRLETRLSCVEVFALGGRVPTDKSHVDYFAVRTVLSSLVRDVVTQVAEVGALSASSPLLARLAGEIVGRFGVVLSDQLAVGAAPVIGAVGGAAVNVVFTDHFQRVAEGHFAIRRLERLYGAGEIERAYHDAVQDLSGLRRRFGRTARRPSETAA